MYHRQVGSESDVLRARFTVWLEKLIMNARTNYLEENKSEIITISIDDLLENEIPVGCEDVSLPLEKGEFEFEEERLAKAFYELPLMKQKILKMLFVDDVKPEFIAQKLNCSPQYVYNQRFRALKMLRNKLNKGGDDL